MDYFATGLKADSCSAVSTSYNEFVFDYSKHTGEGWKDAFIKEHFPIPSYSLRNIVNSLQYRRGLIGGGTEGMKNFLENPDEICGISFGPRLIPNYDTGKITKKGLSDGNLETIYSRSPSLQILSMVMPGDNHMGVENVIEDYEYATLGGIPFDSPEHKKRTERLKETGKKSVNMFNWYSGEILGMSPKMVTRYTSNPAFKNLVTETVTRLGGDPNKGRDRAYVHYTTNLNFCQESCEKKVLGEIVGHMPQLKSWDNLPPWIGENLIQNAIGIMPPISIDGNREMDRGLPLLIGNEEIVESQIGEISRLWEEYKDGAKVISLSLKDYFGDYALPEEKKAEKTIIKIPGGNLGNFISSVTAYMLPEKYNYLFEQLQETSNNAKIETSQDKLKELRKQKKEILQNMWYFSSDYLRMLAKSAD